MVCCHFQCFTTLILKGEIKVDEPEAATCNLSLCRSCVAGKYKCVSLKSTKKSPTPEKIDVLKAGDPQPEDKLSTD